MNFFHLFSLLIVLSALFAYINHKLLKLPNAIGLTLGSLIVSLFVFILSYFNPFLKQEVELLFKNLNFSELLLESMLSFLLFAGAIHIKLEDLKSERLSILLFSTISVLISTFLIGIVGYFILGLFGLKIAFIQSLLFGALISPTDPIAVLSILKKAGISKSLETKIAGESLFNDGVAVVIFITILKLTKTNATLDFINIIKLFSQEAIGGVVFGLIIGYIGFKLISTIDNYVVEVLVTLAIVMGGYSIAHFLHISGPLAMVVAGIITGNQGKTKGMSELTSEYIDKFWELLDEILNAILFVLIGLELLILEMSNKSIIIGLIFTICALIIRYLSVWLPSIIIRLKEDITHKTLLILTWGGLRGGISIALALSIPDELNKSLWVTITYVIVCFSILIQGSTIGKLAKNK